MAHVKRTFSIAGSSFIKGSWAYVERLKPNQRLNALREPDNPYDSNAIALFWANAKLGYVPRGLAAEVAPIIDAGGEVICHKAPNIMVGVCVLHWSTLDESSPEAANQSEKPA